MAKPLLTKLRRELKSILYRERVEWSRSGYTPVCAICNKPPKGGSLQMHETLITRGDVSGNKELGCDIMSKYNCVLVHADCHEFANSEDGKRACALNILRYENHRDVTTWLKCLEKRMKSTTPAEAIRLVNEVNDEVQSMWKRYTGTF